MTRSEQLDPIAVAVDVARSLEKTGIAYFLGGSMASSVQGEPRSTNDIDFVIDPARPEQAAELTAALGSEFDVDVAALAEAIARRTSWNIFHVPSMTKIDLFIRRAGAFDDSEFQRRSPTEIAAGQTLVLKSPEDTVLRKLLWYREGGEASTTQWRDIIEVLRVSGPKLDRAYLERWAIQLSVVELLQRADASAHSPR